MAKIEFYTLCAMLAKQARRKGLSLPTNVDIDHPDTKAFFRKMSFNYGIPTTKDQRPEIVFHWNEMRRLHKYESSIHQRDTITGTW